MTLVASGQISFNDINIELGNGSGTTCNLNSMEASINTLSPSRPNGITPNSMDEWYSYDHAYTTTTCTPADTYYTQYCTGVDLYYTYHNGSCGFYDSLFEANSPTCGYTTTTEAPTTTTAAPVSITWSYTTSCGSSITSFQLYVNGSAVVDVTSDGSGSVSCPVGQDYYAAVSVKDTDCFECSPTLEETGTNTSTATGCPTATSTTRTMEAGWSVDFSATDLA